MSDWCCIKCGDEIYEKEQHPKFLDDGEGPYCEDCFDEFWECEGCGIIMDPDSDEGKNFSEEDGGPFCDDCFCEECGRSKENCTCNDDEWVCQSCGKHFDMDSEDEGKYFSEEDGGPYCEDCFCEECGRSKENCICDDDEWVCANCGKQFDMEDGDEGKYFTSDGDGPYCEECFCEECWRLKSECICDDLISGEDLDLDMDLEIEQNTPPDYDVDRINQIISEEYPGIEEKVSSVTEGMELESKIDTLRTLQFLCNYSGFATDKMGLTIDNCAETLKQRSEIGKKSARLDPSNSTSDVSGLSLGSRFVKSLNGKEVMNFLKSHFNWEYDGEWNKLQCDELVHDFLPKIKKEMEEYVDLLKKLAVKAGYPKDEIDKIKVMFDMTGRLYKENILGETSGYDIYIAYEGTHLAKRFMLTITHEFRHALDNIASEEKTVTALRYRAADEVDNVKADCPPGNEECTSRANTAYFTNFVEKTAYETETRLGESIGVIDSEKAYLISHYGTEIIPTIMESNNTEHGFTGSMMTFVNYLFQLVPELALTPGDFDMREIKELHQENFATDFDSDRYFYLISSVSNNTYVVPSPKYLDELQEATGGAFNPEDFYYKVWDYLGLPDEYGKMSYPEMIRALYDDERGFSSGGRRNRSGTRTGRKTDRPMTAEAFMECITLAEMLKLYNSVVDTRDEETFGKLMDDLLNKSEELESCEDLATELEDLSSELESLCSDAELLQDELSDLADEYTQRAEEYEQANEEFQEMLEALADEIRSECDSIMSDPTSITEAIEDIKSDLENRFQSDKEDLENEAEATLQGMADDLEDLGSEMDAKASELEDLGNDIDDLVSEIESKSAEMEEYESLADEVEDLQEILNKHMQDGIQEISFESRIDVCAVDENGEPIFGIPVSAVDPETNTRVTLGYTDDEGCLSASVDTETYSGWTLIADGNTREARSGSYPYKSKKETDLYFVVKMENNEPVFVIDRKWVLERKAQASTGSKDEKATLRVTICGSTAASGILPSSTAGTRGKSVTWREYYDYWLCSPKILQEGKSRSNPTYAKMNGETVEYYGAYLLPLSDSGELPRMNGKVIFSPLFKMKNSAPALQLVNSDDYSTPSKAFSFGAVPPGRYELAIILPLSISSCYFGEITVKPGENKKVKADRWNPEDDLTSEYYGRNKRTRKERKKYTTTELDTEIYMTNGQKIRSTLSREVYGTIFALAVDATGRTLWSVPGYTSSDKLKVPVYSGWHNSGWNTGSEGDSIEPCVGQIYLLTSERKSTCSIYPATYVCLYMEYKDDTGKIHGRKLQRIVPGRVYGESLASGRTQSKAYVAFWEQYHDAAGNIHYRTYNSAVPFTLYWPIEGYFEGAVDEEVHLVDAVSRNKNGRLANYLSQRKIVKRGASYVYSYTTKDADICRGAAFNRIPSWYAAEQVNMADEMWQADGIFYRMTGTAMMKTYEKDENGITIKRFRKVEPVIYSDEDGTVLRYIVSADAEVQIPTGQELKPAVTTEDLYINRRSNKIHLSTCSHRNLIVDENLSHVVFKDRKAPRTMMETLQAFDFVPCGRCMKKKR